jgi:methionine-rich copper-binding protein CopC
MKSIFKTLILFLMFPAIASAHAFLDHAEPKVGSTDNVAPKQLTLHFTQAVEPSFSSVKVTDADGKQVDKGDTTVDSNDGTRVTLSLQDLPPGTYKVEWKVTSVDTHKTHGSFNFSVKTKG